MNASSNFAAVTFFTVFKMCRHRVNAVLKIRVLQTECVLQFVIIYRIYVVFLQEAPPEGKCLGIFGLSLYTSEKEVRDMCDRYGEVDTCQIVYDHAVSMYILCITLQHN